MNNKKLLSPNALKALVLTIALIALFRFGTNLVISGASPSYTSMVNSSSLFQMLGLSNIGAGLHNYTYFALGVAPFVSASILVQILGLFNPVKRWRDQGDSGRDKQTRLTRILAMVFGSYQAFSAFTSAKFTLSISGASQFAPNANWMTFVAMGIIIVSGTYALSYISDKITQYGLGNGQSVIIATGILANLSTLPKVLSNASMNNLAIVLAGVVLTALLAITFNHLTVKLPVVSSHPSAEKVYMPIKLNPVGMIPIIFAGMLQALPGFINQLWNNKQFAKVVEFLDFNYWSGIASYAVLIVLFSVLYVTVQLNPKELSDRLSNASQSLEGVSIGSDTENFFKSVLQKLGLTSGFVLAILAIMPLVITKFLGISGVSIGLLGSSMIILVTTLSDVASRYMALIAEEAGIKKVEEVVGGVL